MMVVVVVMMVLLMFFFHFIQFFLDVGSDVVFLFQELKGLVEAEG